MDKSKPIIHNGKDVSLDQNPGTLPNMSAALTNWFKVIQLEKVTKETVNHEIVEKTCQLAIRGVIQPYEPTKLEMKMEGQRTWQWFQLHALPDPALYLDDIVWISNIRCRVMTKQNYSAYGYVEYHLQQDYQDRPTAPPYPNVEEILKYTGDIDLTGPSLTADVTVIDSVEDATKAHWRLYLMNDDGSLTPYTEDDAIQVIDTETVRITVDTSGVYRLTGIQPT